MEQPEKNKLLRQIMWDYNIPLTDIEALLSGRIEMAGHYTRKTLFRKMLESYSWYTILQVFTPVEIKNLLTDDTINGLRTSSLKKKYAFVKKRLKEIITDDDMDLKIEFVNDVSYRSGNPIPYYFGQLDTPMNILSNKLGAIISREEPKDIFDIVHISVNFSFNWQDVFSDSKKKSVLNEIDVAERLNTFPSFLLGNIDWNTESIDHDHFDSVLRKIANDFLLGRDNSVCSGINPIIDAKPLST
jgi:hypothetical protein